jgi:hypothetical protein
LVLRSVFCSVRAYRDKRVVGVFVRFSCAASRGRSRATAGAATEAERMSE